MALFGIEALDSLIGSGINASILHSIIIIDEKSTNGYYSSAIERLKFDIRLILLTNF